MAWQKIMETVGYKHRHNSTGGTNMTIMSGCNSKIISPMSRHDDHNICDSMSTMVGRVLVVRDTITMTSDGDRIMDTSRNAVDII